MDKKITKFLKGSRTKNHRTIFIVLGGDGIFKVPVLYKLVAREKSLPVIWFSDNSPDLRNIGWTAEENESGNKEDEESSFPQVTYVSFSDIQKTHYQCGHFSVVQDLKIIRPSDLVSIVESVSGKGAIVFTFSEIKDIDKFISPKACNLTKSRFMKRLLASFTSCSSCLILDDKLDILFAPTCGTDPEKMVEEENILDESKFLQIEDHSEVIEKLTGLCKTRDQSRFLMECLDALKRRTIHCMISASSPRGRGQSHVLGLAIAGAISLKYSTIFISSLSYDNVKIIFKYLLMGLDELQFKENEDYDLIQSVNPEFNDALIGLNIFKDHRQAVRFILPGDVEDSLEHAQLVVVEEAAAMPLPLLKKLLGPYIVLMTSTTEGCGGSGKYLYENMISEICRSPSLKNQDKTVSLKSLFPTSETSSWKQITLSAPVNYSSGDKVERWINHFLCLEDCVTFTQGCPDPENCRLFYVCQETLFSYESYAEKFLQQLMSLFFCTKRSVSPDILQKIADNDDYHIFCLLPPVDNSKKGSNDILCAILVHTEKHIPSNVMYCAISQPEVVPDCFNTWTSPSEGVNEDFLEMQGIHILDIVTYPCFRKMGYGSRALRLMQEFYEGKWVSLDDKPYIYSMKNERPANGDIQSLPPLLLQLTEVEPEKVDYILVSYYLTPDLLRFWKKVEFVPVFIWEEKNFAQEHLCFMMKNIGNDMSTYMSENWTTFCDHYFMHLMSELKCLPAELALNLLICKFSKQLPKKALTKEEINIHLKPLRMKALEKYCQQLGDLHCIMPCVPTLAKLFFKNRFIGIDMPVTQQIILLAFGIQRKTMQEIAAELSLHSTQVHGLFNRTVKKLTTYLTSIIEKEVEKTIAVRDINMEPLSQSLDEELEEAAQKIKEKQMEDLKKLKEMDFSEFAIKGSEDDWTKALQSGRKTLVSIKRLKKAPEDVELPSHEKNNSFKHKKKDMKRKK